LTYAHHGGARDEAFAGRDERAPAPGSIPGVRTPPAIALDPVGARPRDTRLTLPEGLAIHARRVLTRDDCARLRVAMDESAPAEPVGVTGLRDDVEGSRRARSRTPRPATPAP
jgi:hypothetical protein